MFLNHKTIHLLVGLRWWHGLGLEAGVRQVHLGGGADFLLLGCGGAAHESSCRNGPGHRLAAVQEGAAGAVLRPLRHRLAPQVVDQRELEQRAEHKRCMQNI